MAQGYFVFAIATTGDIGEAKQNIALSAPTQRARLKVHTTEAGFDARLFTMIRLGYRKQCQHQQTGGMCHR